MWALMHVCDYLNESVALHGAFQCPPKRRTYSTVCCYMARLA